MKLFKSLATAILLVLLISPTINAENKESSSLESDFFTAEQEKYLAQNPHVYAYFSQLYTGKKKTPDQIAKEYHLSPDISRQYLKALADIQVITTPNEDLTRPVQFLVKGVSTFKAYGPLSTKFTEDMFKQHFEKSMQLINNRQQKTGSKGEDSKQEQYLSSGGFWLTNAEYEEYQNELEAIREKYIQVSKNNLNSKKQDAFRVSIISNAIPNWEPELFTNIKTKF